VRPGLQLGQDDVQLAARWREGEPLQDDDDDEEEPSCRHTMRADQQTPTTSSATQRYVGRSPSEASRSARPIDNKSRGVAPRRAVRPAAEAGQ